jgi:hypothetical protein
LRISDPARSSAARLGIRNEPDKLGDDDPRPFVGVGGFAYDIVGLEVGVGTTDDDGVAGVGEEEAAETESDSGELSTSSPTARLGERSSTDGLLLGIGESQGL